jgi:hypothetical protein
VSVSTPTTTYAYGATATITVHLAGSTTTPTVTLTRDSGSGATVVGTKAVDASGNAVFTASVTQLTSFTGVWGSGSTEQSAGLTVHVAARVVMSQSGATRRSGAYWIIPLGHTFATVATVAPGKYSECVSMLAQYHTASGWHTLGSLPCVHLNGGSHAYAILGYQRALYHLPMRFRATFSGDTNNLAQTSAWMYAEYQ